MAAVHEVPSLYSTAAPPQVGLLQLFHCPLLKDK